MIKFLHKKHINKTQKENRFIIYYSVSDIVLGTLLMGLVGFFVYNYVTTQDIALANSLPCLQQKVFKK